jgi:transposase-like protein
MDRQRTVDGRRKWRQWSEAEARKALIELAESGESLEQFARKKGVSAQRVYYWRKRLAQAVTPAFVAVPVTAAARAQIEIAFERVTVRVREDLDLARLADIIDVVARSGAGC